MAALCRARQRSTTQAPLVGVLVSLADNDELTKGSWLNTKQYFILTGSVRVFRAQITQNVDQLAATVSWEHLGSCTGINYKDVA